MSENGVKTVETDADLLDAVRRTVREWKPPHGCSLVWFKTCAMGRLVELRVQLSWTKPPVKGLARTEFFELEYTVSRRSLHFLESNLCDAVEAKIDAIVHADSVRLLARGKRGQTADQDRFEAEKKGLTVTYFSRNLLVNNAAALEQYLTKGELCPT
jgi:hypothetical protein